MPIGEFYFHLTHHIVPGPQGPSYFVPLILLPIALLIPRRVLSRWQSIVVFVPITTASTIHAWCQMGGMDVISVDVLLWSLFLLAFKDPWEDFERLILSSRKEHDRSSSKDALRGSSIDCSTTSVGQIMSRQAYPTIFWDRLKWVGTLLISIRLDNWTTRQPSHDKAQPASRVSQSRLQFILQTLVNFIKGYIVLDLTSAYVSRDDYFTNPTISINSPLPFMELRYISPQLVRTAIIGAQAWALISQLFYLPCIFPVGLNAMGFITDEWSPHTWSPYFGSPLVVLHHGVRGFWNEYWHQTMRHTVSGPGYSVADILGLRAGLARYITITMIAFGLSGIVHMGLVPPSPLHATVSPNIVRLYVAAFFWVQPLSIIAETLTTNLPTNSCSLGVRDGVMGQACRMIVTGCCVLAWFNACLPLLGEAGKQLGYWRVWIVPVSLWKGVRGVGWITWPLLGFA